MVKEDSGKQQQQKIMNYFGMEIRVKDKICVFFDVSNFFMRLVKGTEFVLVWIIARSETK